MLNKSRRRSARVASEDDPLDFPVGDKPTTNTDLGDQFRTAWHVRAHHRTVFANDGNFGNILCCGSNFLESLVASLALERTSGSNIGSMDR